MASPPQSPAPRVRNPRTQRLHHREALWQIGLPVVLACLAVIALMGLTVFVTDVSTRSVFADVSLILLILPAAVGALVALALVAGACVGVWYVLREVPFLFKQAQDFMKLIADYTRQVAGRITGSLMSVQSAASAAQKTLADVRSTFTFRRRR
jgi:cell division protein FtsW (lipid II flippase)